MMLEHPLSAPPLRALFVLALVALLAAPLAATAGAPPSVLLVTAHPDDETLFAGTVHALVRRLGAAVDLAVVTNGEGGFRYAALAEPLYGLDLTDERVGRAHLPRIRQRELLAAAELLGIRSLFFLDQPDRGFTSDAREVLERQWETPAVRSRLRGILARGRYGFVFVPLPTPASHGAHQAAAIVALAAVEDLPAGERPAILGAATARREAAGERRERARSEAPRPAREDLPELAPARVPPERPVLEFDRTAPIDAETGLDSRTVVDWVVAAHKSQGRLQAEPRDELERFFEFALNDDRAVAAAEALFARLHGAGAPGADGGVEAGENRPRWYGVCPIEP